MTAKFYSKPINDYTTSTGTGTLTAFYTAGTNTDGALGVVVTAGDQVQLCIIDAAGNFEVSLCTILISSSGVVTFTRDSVLSSSNGGSAVNWAAGIKKITQTVPDILYSYLFSKSVLPQAFGSGTGTFFGEGNLFKFVDSTGGTNAIATAQDTVVAAYTLPANSIDQLLTRGLILTSSGNKANNGNSVQAKIWWNATTATIGSAVSGGTLVGDTGASTTSGGVGWYLETEIWGDLNAGANKAMFQEIATIVGHDHGGMGTAAQLGTTLTGAIKIAFTVKATTAATDISLWNAFVNAMN